MKAAELYDRLEQDFKLSICADDWYIEDSLPFWLMLLQEIMGLIFLPGRIIQLKSLPV